MSDAAPAASRAAALRPWWPLVAILGIAAAVRLSTLGLQSYWYDEAFTPVHVLRSSLGATLHGVLHTENSPPLWYLIAWVWSKLFDTGPVALRSISALAGIGTVGVGWLIGRELAGRRAAIACAGLVAVNPLLVWYSQEARVYALFVLLASIGFLLFLRAERDPTPARLGAWALASAAALLSHYFAVFLLVPQAVWLLAQLGRRAWPAVGAVGVVGLALVPLVTAQGGHGTQWIGRWALSSRLGAIPQYYLTGESGAPLGHAIELAVFLPIAGLLALAPGLASAERRRAVLAAAVGVFALAAPAAMALLGADYLAPRNLVAVWVPVTAALAAIAAASRAGVLVAAALAAGWLALVVDVNLSPRLQRGDWGGVAAVLRGGSADRAIVTPQLGTAPLEYYLAPLRPLARGRTARVSEIDLVGYRPLTASAGAPPAPGFGLVERRWVNGLLVYRFRAPTPLVLSQSRLRSRAINRERPEVLVTGT